MKEWETDTREVVDQVREVYRRKACVLLCVFQASSGIGRNIVRFHSHCTAFQADMIDALEGMAVTRGEGRRKKNLKVGQGAAKGSLPWRSSSVISKRLLTGQKLIFSMPIFTISQQDFPQGNAAEDPAKESSDASLRLAECSSMAQNFALLHH